MTENAGLANGSKIFMALIALLALLAGGVTDRLMVESRLARMSEQITTLGAVITSLASQKTATDTLLGDIKAHQIRNEAIIEEQGREIEALKRRARLND